MNCFVHSPAAAIGICKHCGRGLCRDCVVEVALSLACKGRCETEVAAMNELTHRAKSSFQKAASSYTKMAVFMGLAGLLFTGLGALTLNIDKAGFIPLALGLLFLLGAAGLFHSARSYRSRD